MWNFKVPFGSYTKYVHQCISTLKFFLKNNICKDASNVMPISDLLKWCDKQVEFQKKGLKKKNRNNSVFCLFSFFSAETLLFLLTHFKLTCSEILFCINCFSLETWQGEATCLWDLLVRRGNNSYLGNVFSPRSIQPDMKANVSQTCKYLLYSSAFLDALFYYKKLAHNKMFCFLTLLWSISNKWVCKLKTKNTRLCYDDWHKNKSESNLRCLSYSLWAL